MQDDRLAGAVVGGLVAGLGLSALLLAGERRSGKPSELVALERRSAQRIGLRTPAPRALPSRGEQGFVQGGHLLLSAAAGAAYVAATDRHADTLSSGLLFGAAFYAALHWVAGPLLGAKPPEWRSSPAAIGMHTVNHLMFGLVTALGAKLAAGR